MAAAGATPHGAHIALGDIRPTAVQQWISDLGRGTTDAKPVGASRGEADALRAVWGSWPTPSADNLSQEPGGGRQAAPDDPQAARLPHPSAGGALATASGEYEGLVLLLAYTGLRWGEAIGLRVRDLDMLRRRATVSENAVQSGRQIHVGHPQGPQAAHRAAAGVPAGLPGPPVRGPGPRGSAVPRRRRRAPAPPAPHRGGSPRRSPIQDSAHHPARPPAHRGQPRGVGRGERQSGAEDARPRLGGDDVGHLRRPVRRRSGSRRDARWMRRDHAKMWAKCGHGVGSRPPKLDDSPRFVVPTKAIF